MGACCVAWTFVPCRWRGRARCVSSQQCSSSENVRGDAKQLRQGLQASEWWNREPQQCGCRGSRPIIYLLVVTVTPKKASCRPADVPSVTLTDWCDPECVGLCVCGEKCHWELHALRPSAKCEKTAEALPGNCLSFYFLPSPFFFFFLFGLQKILGDSFCAKKEEQKSGKTGSVCHHPSCT